MAQRFYELLSYKMFATLKHRRPRATLRYTDYCLLSTQQRYTEAIAMQKQMYKVHRPHVASGYLTAVHYEATTDADGGPDWFMHYTPGPKARDEFAAFTRQSGHEGDRHAVSPRGRTARRHVVATVVRERPALRPPAPPAASTGASDAATPPACQMEPPPSTRVDVQPPASTDPLEAQAQALVDAFHQRFHGRAPGTASSQRTGARHAAPDGAWRDQSAFSPHLCAAGRPRDRLPAQVFRRHPALPPRGAGGL